MYKDIFISHTWQKDKNGRNNHTRCKNLCDKLINKGYSIWFDHYDMGRDVNTSITYAIDNCKVFIVCLTKAYCDKINNAVKDNKLNDNCYKEWNYAIYRNKYIIPVIMEKDMTIDYSNKEGIINMYLNSLIYYDITDDDYATNDFNVVCKNLRKQGIYNNSEKEILRIRETLSFNSFLEYISQNFKNTKPVSENRIKPRTIVYL